MANKLQVKRTTISGRTPNTTNSGNTHYIDTGELALNLTDGKMFSSNGSVYFEIGASLANQTVSGTANVNKLNVTASSGDEGGEIFLAAPANTTLAGGITIDAYQNKLRFFEQGGNARGAFIDLTACANGVATNLLTGGVGGTGTVTQVNTGIGLSGGPITATGTISVVANNGIVANTSGLFANAGTGLVVNATGIHVNSSYIGTLAANSATYLGGNTALELRNYSDTVAGTAYSNAVANAASYTDSKAGTAYTNATAFSANATNISSGTLDASRLPASAVQNTDSRTLSGNLVISGTSFTPSSNTILLGNSTQRWIVSANTVDASGLITGSAGANITGTANLVDVNISGNLTVSGTTTYINTTTLNVGDNIVSLNADLGALVAPTENAGLEINRGSSANVSFLWNETSDSWTSGNSDITGYANASVSVNSALLSVGSSFIANTTGVYHTGTVNAASFTTSGLRANTTAIVPTSNTILLGNSTGRFVLSANTGDFTGTVVAAADVRLSSNSSLHLGGNSTVSVYYIQYNSASNSIDFVLT